MLLLELSIFSPKPGQRLVRRTTHLALACRTAAQQAPATFRPPPLRCRRRCSRLRYRNSSRLCSTYDFNSWVDLIFKIDGSYPAERLIAELTSRSVTPAAGNELTNLGQYSFIFGLPNTVTDQHLVGDYYLIRFQM